MAEVADGGDLSKKMDGSVTFGGEDIFEDSDRHHTPPTEDELFAMSMDVQSTPLQSIEFCVEKEGSSPRRKPHARRRIILPPMADGDSLSGLDLQTKPWLCLTQGLCGLLDLVEQMMRLPPPPPPTIGAVSACASVPAAQPSPVRSQSMPTKSAPKTYIPQHVRESPKHVRKMWESVIIGPLGGRAGHDHVV